MPKDKRESVDAHRLLAIEYYHNRQDEKAEEVWRLIER